MLSGNTQTPLCINFELFSLFLQEKSVWNLTDLEPEIISYKNGKKIQNL